ncbi:MAG: ParB/RepB/Spo0J family partition protein [bacterium]
MSRAEEFGAVARLNGYNYEPEALTIVTDKSHPLYDERVHLPLDESLVLSIMADGVLDPVMVRKNGEDKHGNPIVEVIDGRQRVRCCIEANRRLKEAGSDKHWLVPATSRRANGEESMGYMITRNSIRTDDTPMVEALKLRRYLDAGHDEKQARIRFGFDARGMRSALMLLSCSAVVQKLLEQERLAVSVARDLSTLPEAEQDAKILEFEAAGLLSVRSPKAAKEAKEARGGRGRKRKAPKFRLRPAKAVAPQMEALAAREKTLSPMGKGVLAAMRWMFGDDKALDACIDTESGK